MMLGLLVPSWQLPWLISFENRSSPPPLASALAFIVAEADRQRLIVADDLQSNLAALGVEEGEQLLDAGEFLFLCADDDVAGLQADARRRAAGSHLFDPDAAFGHFEVDGKLFVEIANDEITTDDLFRQIRLRRR